MKSLLFFFLLISVSAFAAESVKIETKMYSAFYKDEYRSDTAIYKLPIVTGGVSKEIMDKLNAYLSSDSILGDNIDSVLANYRQYGSGQTSCEYTILYNENGALSISVYIETLGAYPDSYYQDINLNLNSGERILITDLIKRNRMDALANRLNDTVQKRIKDKIKEENIASDDANWMFNEIKFTTENLSTFAIKKGGIVFYFDYGLPHVAKALSPDEDMWMTWDRLSNYLREDGLGKNFK